MDVDDFLLLNVGYDPGEEIKKNINNTIGYLKDNQYSDNEIEKILMSFNNINDIKSENLPERLWENSLLKMIG